MMKVCYSEMDGPKGLSCRMEAAGHAGYAPAGQDIVCAGASTLMQALVYLFAGEENASTEAWDEPEGPRMAVTVEAPCEEWVRGAFELAKAGFCLLAERYPDHVRFADVSRRAEDSMVNLQMFAADAAPAISAAQTQQAMASGTLKAEAAQPAQSAETAAPEPAEAKEPETPEPQESCPQPVQPLPRGLRNAVEELHRRWAAEEAQLRRSVPEFALQKELRDPEMRRLMQMPGMRVQDAYRLTHYQETLDRTARTVEQGVMERVRQRAARPTENGIRPGGAATVHPDVSSMTRAQREALERRVMQGAQIRL